MLVVALLVGGGAPAPSPAGLPDAGAVTGWGLPVAHLAVRSLAVLTIGQLVFVALLVPATRTGPSAGALRALRGSAWTSAGWLVAEAVALVLTVSTVYGAPVSRLSTQAVAAAVTELTVGRVSLAVALLLTLVAGGSAALARRPSRRTRAGATLLLLTAAVAAVVPGIFAGHPAAAGNHVAAVLALSVHVLAASLWVGGLTALLLHGRRGFESVTVVRRFSTLALGCVLLLVLSGVGSALLVAGPPSWSWVGEGWVRLLAAKTVLLVALALMGARHRRTTLPALSAGRPRAFVRLAAGEVVVMALAVTVSVALGTSAAPTPPAPPATGAAAPAGSTGPAAGDPAPEVPAGDAAPEGDGPVSASEQERGDEPVVEDMSGHDHGDLSVTVLVDAERFHVSAAVRPGQPVTVYNSSDVDATLTSVDGTGGTADGSAFDVDVPARTFISFEAPDQEGDYAFVSRPGGAAVDGFAATLPVRADP